eukprot:m.101118 g.101118  ORF g.101118 m.101118 type:complete len:203 (-) comp14960_c0_seq2:258-866(-)
MSEASLINTANLANIQVLSGQVNPEFDISALTVDELREELARRKMEASGSKTVLCERLFKAISSGQTVPKRLSNSLSKKKRPHTRKEPQREDYKTEEEYLKVWHKWRNARNNNNKSVKKSRETQRIRREKHEVLCKQREEENQKIEADLRVLKENINLLVRAVQQPDDLTPAEMQDLRDLLMQKQDQYLMMPPLGEDGSLPN